MRDAICFRSEELYLAVNQEAIPMIAPICDQTYIEEDSLLEFKLCDDQGLFDLTPDPYDDEIGFSPSDFHPDMPHESREGSEGEPEPEKPSG